MTIHTLTQAPDDLEALFDSIVAGNAAEIASHDKQAANAASLDAGLDSGKVINQLGQMARNLHNALFELGQDKEIVKAASFIPDTRARLIHVATLAQQAAERVLNATEAAQPVVEKLEVEAYRLSGQWQLLFEKKLDVEQFKNLVMQTHGFLYEVPKQTKVTNAYLMEIMMAQDFQDLTGQVITRIIEVTQEIEQSLIRLLLESAPEAVKAQIAAKLQHAALSYASGNKNMTVSQEQVDELLESLGF